MDTRVVFLACLCLVSRVYGAAFGEDCTDVGDCTGEHVACTNAKCACATDYAYDTSATACKVRQGGPCTGADASVCVRYTTCSNDACTCKPGSKIDGDLCVEVYDTTCANDAACSALQHSQCKEGNPKQCKCADGYKIGTDMPKTCSAVIGGECTTATDCTGKVEHSTCLDSSGSKSCVCVNGYKGATCAKIYDTTTCTVDSDCDGLKYGKCSATKCKCDDTKAVNDGDLCYLKIDEACTGTDICPANSNCDGSTNKCKCNDNFEKTDTYTCKEQNSGMTVKASVLLLVAALTAVFIR